MDFLGELSIDATTKKVLVGYMETQVLSEIIKDIRNCTLNCLLNGNRIVLISNLYFETAEYTYCSKHYTCLILHPNALTHSDRAV